MTPTAIFRARTASGASCSIVSQASLCHFTGTEALSIINRLVDVRLEVSALSDQRVLVSARVFGGMAVSAEMWRPSAAVIGVYARAANAPPETLGERYLSLDITEISRFFRNHIRSVAGYRGNGPIFHACDFAAALVAFNRNESAGLMIEPRIP